MFTRVLSQSKDKFTRHPAAFGPYDAGHNSGLIASDPDDSGPVRPPSIYIESSKNLQYVKALLIAGFSIAPYFAVLDQLGAVNNHFFSPCNEEACRYTRIFNSDYIPGSGINVISVQNGVSRPFAMHYSNFTIFSCPYIPRDDPRGSPIYDSFRYTCRSSAEDDWGQFYEDHEHVSDIVNYESERASEFNMWMRASFIVAKTPFLILTAPLNIISASKEFWGMEHVPNGKCPGKSRQEMLDTCTHPKTKHNIDNHMATWSPSKIGVVVGLIGRALFDWLHDVLLMKNVSEKRTLVVGAVSIVFHGLAVASTFLWALGATEVFVATVGESAECVCFYSLNPVRTLVSLLTPIFLLISFAARVEVSGMCCLFGDRLYYLRFDVPYYLARQSFLWTWGILVSPKLAGTVQGLSRNEYEKKYSNGEEFTAVDFKFMAHLQRALYYTRLVVIRGFVAFVFGSEILTMKSLLANITLDEEQTRTAKLVITYLVLPLPSLFALIFGCIDVVDLYDWCFPEKACCSNRTGTFTKHIRALMPSFTEGVSRVFPDAVATGRQSNKCFAWFTFVVGAITSLSFTVAVVHGLSPGLHVLLQHERLKPPSLVQAELWSACGFAFAFWHIPIIIRTIYPTYEDVVTLEQLGNKPAESDASGLTEKSYVSISARQE